MTRIDDTELRAALLLVREQLVLQHDDAASADLIRQRALADVATGRRRRRLTVPVAVTAAFLGVGASVAVAVSVAYDDGSQAAFQHLHPDKANATASTEEPHVLIGDLDQGRGVLIRAYTTTRSGLGACVLVEHVTVAGAQIDSVSYCGDEPAAIADVRLVNGAEIGWVPDSSVASVTVTAGGSSATTAVVAHHFLLAPSMATTTGSTVTVTGRRADGHLVSVWNVAVN
jgi:hypothetical protein